MATKKAVTKKPAKKSTKKTKAKASHCEIVVLLDRSGSMASVREDMMGGYDTFIEGQKAGSGTCNVTLVQFDWSFGKPMIETVYEGKPIAEVPKLSFEPRGSTPLLDAFGKTLSETKLRIKDKDTKVIFLVITDGYENASQEWKREQIKAEVEKCTKLGWLFQFLGADIDAFGEAASLGIKSISTMDYDKTSKGVNAMYCASSSSAMRYRTSNHVGEQALDDAAFTEEERKSTKG